MSHVVFVHGTGVREPAFTETLKAVRSGLSAVLNDITVHPCYWGGSHGSNIGEGVSIPLYTQSLGIGAPSQQHDALAEWAMLLNDPMLEVRLLAARSRGTGSGTPGRSLAIIMRETLAKLDASVAAKGFDGFDPVQTNIYRRAVAEVLAVPDLDDAVLGGVKLEYRGADGADAIRALLSRAIVASWMAALLDLQRELPIAAARDALVEETTTRLGGSKSQTLGLGSSLQSLVMAPIKAIMRNVAVEPSLRMATWGSKRYRHSIAEAATPAAGDVLLYQARGDAIRKFILETAISVGEPVVLLAHSLGGIACVDLCLAQAHPEIKAIITAGSQSPFLYEIGALSKRLPGKAMPPYMPPWLNFYDKNDLLSFLASPIMRGETNRVEDVEVMSGQPFPASHSAYWSNPAVWEAAAKFIKQL